AQSKAGVDRTSPLPAQLRKGLLARSAKVLLQAVSQRRPLVIVMDDCHWLDGASAAIIEEAIGDLADVPLGWILLHRPGWTPPAAWPIWTSLSLEPLDASASEQLAWALLGAAATPSAVQFVVERAEGNPLYLVELCGAMADPAAASAIENHDTRSGSAEPRY